MDVPEENVSIRDLAGSGMDAESVGLVGDLLTASARSLSATQNTLWQNERLRRMALEVRIYEFLDKAESAYLGTVREYERAIDTLRFPMPNDKYYAERHPEYEEN